MKARRNEMALAKAEQLYFQGLGKMYKVFYLDNYMLSLVLVREIAKKLLHLEPTVFQQDGYDNIQQKHGRFTKFGCPADQEPD